MDLKWSANQLSLHLMWCSNLTFKANGCGFMASNTMRCNKNTYRRVMAWHWPQFVSVWAMKEWRIQYKTFTFILTRSECIARCHTGESLQTGQAHFIWLVQLRHIYHTYYCYNWHFNVPRHTLWPEIIWYLHPTIHYLCRLSVKGRGEAIANSSWLHKAFGFPPLEIFSGTTCFADRPQS